MDPICIIIPCYNEFRRFPADEFLDFSKQHPETSFCLVNDGSNDDTGKLLESLREQLPERIIVRTLSENKGKAEAVRTGMLHAMKQFDAGYFAYFDADFSTSPEESFRLRDSLLEKSTLECAFGSRVAILGRKIDRKLSRHITGRIIATFISGILHLMVYDTQCGAKLFKRSLAMKVFENPFISRWLFDVEIMARITGLYNDQRPEEIMIEVPVKSWSDKGGSKIGWTYGFRVLFDLLKIRQNYKTILRNKH